MSKVLVIIFVVAIVLAIIILALRMELTIGKWNKEVHDLYSKLKDEALCVTNYYSVKATKTVYLEIDIYHTPYRLMYNELWAMEDTYPDVYFTDCSKEIVYDCIWNAAFPYIKDFCERTDATAVDLTITSASTVEQKYSYEPKWNEWKEK